jgi:hypothetical protein
VDGLLAPVACSASDFGCQTIRMEPVFMALGAACGIAAQTTVDAKAEVRAVNVPAVLNPSSAAGKTVSLICNALRKTSAVFLHYILYSFGPAW